MSLVPVLDYSSEILNVSTPTTVSSEQDSTLPEWPENHARDVLATYGFSEEAKAAVLQEMEFHSKSRVFFHICMKIANLFVLRRFILTPAELLHLRAYAIFLHKLFHNLYPDKIIPVRDTSFEENEKVLADWVKLFNDTAESYFMQNRHGMRRFLYDFACETNPMLLETYKRPV